MPFLSPSRFSPPLVALALVAMSCSSGFAAGAALDKPDVTIPGKASDEPFTLSARLPEGNYRVTVVLGGDPKAASVTTVKAEQRRLMLERIETAPDQTETRSFLVNIRTTAIGTTGEHVHLKAREKESEKEQWDDRLTLQFTGTHPAVQSVRIAPAPASAPTVFILGDSTVCDQPREPYNSWGQMLPRFFGPDVAVANHAESGESLRSSLGAKRLDKVLSAMRPGDYLFIQYGHNDQKEKGEGVGAYTTYTADLKKFVEGAKSKGGHPVLVTPVSRRRFDSAGKVVESLGDYPDAVRKLAKEERLPLIDLNAMSKPFYAALGPTVSPRAFAPGDGTHHNDYGSYEIARCVVEGIRQNISDLAKLLASDIRPFDPEHPDPIDSFALPVDPLSTTVKPLGN